MLGILYSTLPLRVSPLPSQYSLVVRGFSFSLLMLILLSTLRIRLQYNSRQTWRSVYFMVSSCIPLSQYKSQVVCCRERLRVIVFDKIAILSFERASTFTNILYFVDASKYFVWCDPWLVQVASNFFHTLIVVHRFTAVKNTNCLSLLRLGPLGINPLLIIECISPTFPT